MSKPITTLSVFAESNGEQWIMATHKSQPCGCVIVGGGTIPSPLDIKYCPVHAAAQDLLEACKLVFELADLNEGLEQVVGTAIAKAKGK